MEPRSSQWRLTSIGMVVVIAAALLTGLLVARWWGVEISRMDVQSSSQETSKPVELSPRSFAPAASPETAAPPKAATEACHAEAARVSGPKTTTDDVPIDEESRAAYASCMQRKGYR